MLVVISFLLILLTCVCSESAPNELDDVATEDATFINTILEDHDIQFKIARLATSRSYSERIAISREYERLHNTSLIEALLLTSLSGETGKLIQGLFSTSAEFYAMEINRAVIGLGTDEKALNDVLCCLDDLTVDEIRYEYRRLFGRSMDEDIIDDVSGPYEQFLGDVIAMRRLPWANARQIALMVTDHYINAANGSVPDPWFFSRSPYATIRKVSNHLQNVIGMNFPDYFSILRDEYRDDLTQLLCAIASYSQNPLRYYTNLLWNAYEEGDNKRLTRIIVSWTNSKRKLEYLMADFELLAKTRRTDAWMIQAYPSDSEPLHRYIIQKLLFGEAIEADVKANMESITERFPAFFPIREDFRNHLRDIVKVAMFLK
ncbi:Annexin A13 [Orchesella cincta]|uniref:Annexin A13 n=1 Tax=Orchesella cincta TaxID=48709 RepID=A0A1D2MWL5_ORCCI|nr:Annexin A13 [Orchesella cincta]